MHDQLASRLVSSAITALESTLVPEPKSEHAATQLDMVIRTLRLLQSQFGPRVEHLQRSIVELQRLLRDIGLQVPAAGEASCSPVVAQRSPREQLEVDNDGLNAQIADRIPALLQQAATGGESARQAVALLTDIVSTQTEFLAAQDPDILGGSAVIFRGGRIDRSQKQDATVTPLAVTPERLASYLQGRRADSTPVTVHTVNILPGGYSKTTILFEYSVAGGEPQRCVIRKDLSADFLMMGKSAADEYPLLERLYAAGLTVARPLWLELDKTIFDGSFFVCEAVPGTSNIQQWIARSGSVSQQLASLLAKLHRYSLADVGWSDGQHLISAGQAMEQEIGYWQALYEKRRTARHPLLEISLAWVRQNIPAELYDQPARVVHGDVGFHNLMVRDGEIMALLDWEFAHRGAPAEDLNYVRPFVEQIADWSQFIEAYRSAGGVDCSVEVEAYFKVWAFVRNAAGTRDAGYLFENHLPDEIKLALPGWIFGHYLEVDASKMVLDQLSTRL